VSEWRSVKVDRGDAGVRVDRVLLRHLREEKGVSRNRIQKWIETGNVLINGVAANRPSWRMQAGDELRVLPVGVVKRERPRAEAIALEVLYEDDDLIAINKPPGLVVHPSYKNTNGTLMNGVLDRARSWPAESSPGLLGRLDKMTSGVVIVTKRAEIQAALQRAAAANRVDKDYLAIVLGKPSPLRGSINLALDRDPWDRRRITVTDRGGQPSVTKYERLSTAGGYSLVRCRLITGRMHQIRVHMAAKKWPIVGDAVYGSESAMAFPRQALHAWRISMRQPKTGRELMIEAPLPEDMRMLADKLGLAL
jgi:23S rRNA pseudouridine1911/1915/1917 synthase